MLELSELNLQLAFVTARTLSEDIQDQTDAIDDAAGELLFEIALLGGRQLMIEDNQCGSFRGDAHGDLRDLAFAGERRRVGTIAPALYQSGDSEPATQRKLSQLFDAGGLIRLAEVEIDQQRAVA